MDLQYIIFWAIYKYEQCSYGNFEYNIQYGTAVVMKIVVLNSIKKRRIHIVICIYIVIYTYIHTYVHKYIQCAI